MGRTIRMAALCAGVLLTAGAGAQGQTQRLSLEAVSNRADLISGGDVLLRMKGPPDVKLTVNGGQAWAQMGAGADSRLVLVSRLPVGKSVIEASAGGRRARLTVVNHPNGGPLFSGPQIQPWTCLAGAVNAQCDRPPTFSFKYMPTSGGAFKDYDRARGAPDVATITTPDGARTPYIVRVESLTQNRSGVQIATLFDPAQPWTPFAPQAQWNKGVYVLQGAGCGTGYGEQAAGDPLNDNALKKGFVVVTVALLHNTINCNPVVQAEAALMAKEHIAETYGPFDLVFAQGSSGGAISQLMDQNAYPGLYDGLILNHLFADSDASRVAAYDCMLVNEAMKLTGEWTDHARSAVTGMLSGCASSPTRFQIYNPSVGTSCTVPEAARYKAGTNPKGVRCTLQDYQANVVGRRKDGFAYGRLDNEGVQYGLKALLSGAITTDQFVDLNAAAGGHDIDFNRIAERTVADREGLSRLYRTGIANTLTNLAETPIIETRLNVTDFHQPFHAVMVRARLEEAQGHHENYALWKTAEARQAGLNEAAFDVMVAWIRAIKADSRDVPKARKVIDNRPPLARDRCIVAGKDAEPSACPRPPELTRTLAGAPDANYPGKCRLKPLSRRDYGSVAFTETQWTRMKITFPKGVCDYSKPMEAFRRTEPWLTYAGGLPAPMGGGR